MVLTKINNWVFIFIILCSTSLYKLTALGSFRRVAELLGVLVILAVWILSIVYSDQKGNKKQYVLPISLIFLSVITSMFTVYFTRDQSIGLTILAQRAIYYYALYFLLHRLKISVKDIETIWVFLGITYIILYLIQYFAYPSIIFDAYVRLDRGTVRIYLPGSDYMFITFFLCAQYFFRTFRMKYLILFLTIASIFILSGGRQIMATVVLVLVLFLFFDRQIKSRFLLSFLGLVGIFAGFIIFRGVFEGILLESRHDLSLGEDYARFKAAEYYLTDFFKSPIAYITGNGMYFSTSSYGREIDYNTLVRRYVLGDVGLIGNYAIYGAFFILGVLIICYKTLITKIESRYTYIKLMFLTMVISLLIAGGFGSSDTICFTVTMLYILDISRSSFIQSTIEGKKQPDTELVHH